MTVTCYGQDVVAIGGILTNYPDPYQVGYIYAIAKILQNLRFYSVNLR